jgi:hypothetical protein
MSELHGVMHIAFSQVGVGSTHGEGVDQLALLHV